MSNIVNRKPVNITDIDGVPATAFFCRLTIRQLYQFVEHVTRDQTPDLVALCCGKDLDWVDTLSDESFSELSKMAVAENFQRAMKIAQSDQVIAVKLMPVLTKLVGASRSLVQMQKDAGTNMSGLSPEPAPAASAEATGSAS